MSGLGNKAECPPPPHSRPSAGTLGSNPPRMHTLEGDVQGAPRRRERWCPQCVGESSCPRPTVLCWHVLEAGSEAGCVPRASGPQGTRCRRSSGCVWSPHACIHCHSGRAGSPSAQAPGHPQRRGSVAAASARGACPAPLLPRSRAMLPQSRQALALPSKGHFCLSQLLKFKRK